MIPRKLIYKYQRELVKEHLRSLQGHDRYLRFGAMLTDELINSYVDRCWGTHMDAWFGIIENNKIIAVIHVAKEKENKAELGLSVNSDWRGKKLGQALFERAVIYLKAIDVKHVFMHCLSENAIMRHIALKNSMEMRTFYGETDADITIENNKFIDPAVEVLTEQLAIYDNNVRKVRSAWKNYLESIALA